MQPILLTRFWHRRITEATMFISAVVMALYTATLLEPASQLGRLFPVDTITAGIAAATFVVSLILYFKPPAKQISHATFIAYALLVLTIASTVTATGESDSPLIGLWITISVFAGVFGWRGYALVLLLVAGYDGYAYATGWAPLSSIVIATVASVAPLIASFIIWHSKSSSDIRHDKAYRELATELSHESNKSDTVINAINDGVVSINAQGVIQLINPAAQRIIGWGQDDAVGLSYKSVVKLNNQQDKPVEPNEDPVQRVLTNNQEVRSEDLSVTTEAGKKVILSLVVSPIGSPGTGAILVFRDITKEKLDEREQAEFISTASHEMRTPVASIEGYLGLALNPATATIDEKARDYIQKAHESARHLGRLFQDLLDVTKTDDGRMTNNPKVVDMVEYVGGIVEGLKPNAVDKGLTFVYKPAPSSSETERHVAPVYYAHVDNDHLREVVSNLVENAIKYTRQGDVIIDVTGDDGHVRVSIQDSGVGIPSEDISHLFQKFYRVDNSDTREIGGTGLGLYLCRRLAEMMGGQILVESEYKKGSTFTLELPRIDHTEAQRLIDVSATSDELSSTPIQAITEPPLPSFMPQDTPAAQPASVPAPAPQQQNDVAPVPAQSQPQAPVATAPAVQTQPVYSQPQPVAAPQQTYNPAPQPQSSSQPPVQQPPMTLSQLEQDPSGYLSQRASMQIPARQPDEQNKA